MALEFILYYLCFVNGVTFLLYGLDKRSAIKQRRRISEKTLHLWMFMGGSIGALFGQKIFRHKTVKGSFQIIFWTLALLQIGIFIFIIYKF